MMFLKKGLQKALNDTGKQYNDIPRLLTEFLVGCSWPVAVAVRTTNISNLHAHIYVNLARGYVYLAGNDI